MQSTFTTFADITKLAATTSTLESERISNRPLDIDLMSCKCFVIDGLESSTIFIDIPHRFCAKAFHSLGLSSSPTSLKMTRCSTLLSSKSSDFGSPHFHSLHQRNFWVNPPSFLSLFLLLVSLVPSLSVVFSNPHPAHYVFLFFLLAGNLLSCTLG